MMTDADEDEVRAVLQPLDTLAMIRGNEYVMTEAELLTELQARRTGEDLAQGRLTAVLDEVRAVLQELDNMAMLRGNESLFRKCRDRLRKVLNDA